jgi:hypothetical protein
VSRVLEQFLITGSINSISDAIQSLAWPAVAILIATMFRAEMGKVMERLVQLKFHDFEARFRRDLQESEGLNVATPQPRLIDLPSDARRVFHEADGPPVVALKAVAGPPRTVIADSWSEVTKAAERAAGVVGANAINLLVERGVLAGPSLQLFERLRQLQTQVGLHTKWSPAPADADRFAELASPLLAQLKQAAPPKEVPHI